MTKNLKIIVGVGALIVALIVAFPVLGIHTKFVDSEVAEAGPIFDTSGASGLASDEMTQEEADEMNNFMVDNDVPAEVPSEEAEPEMPEIIRVVEGTLIDRSHAGDGTVVVLTDGSEQRFLRFEDDFSVDNGPDLNVYLVANTSADGETETFDDDFIDLGDLKGNIGSQNYEIPVDADLDLYNTVVIWCVRFGVAFNAVDLA